MLSDHHMESFQKAMVDDNGYNYLANYSHLFDKDELLRVAKELLYAIHILQSDDPVIVKAILKFASENVLGDWAD